MGQRTKSDSYFPAFPLLLALSLVPTTLSLLWRRAVSCQPSAGSPSQGVAWDDRTVPVRASEKAQCWARQ